MLRLASRGSTLALWQSHHVRSQLPALHDGIDIEIEVVHTTGDRITDVPLAMIGDRGLFTKEVDNAVIDGSADFAVHSCKDVPTRLPSGLTIAAILDREDPRDAFLPAPGRARTVAELDAGARIGTSSVRRRALLLAARPDIVVDDLRGNLDTRIEKLAGGRYDGIVLARAGVRRFGRDDLVGELLGPPHWLPAAGQGALAIVARSDDYETLARIRPLNDDAARSATNAERAFLACLEGGCQIPIGALATLDGEFLDVLGLVASLDGRTVIRGEIRGRAEHAERVGEELAHRLIADGAGDVLRAVRFASEDTPEPPAP
jgi:hydroxymethylbilane synthase